MWDLVSHGWFNWSPPGESILTQWSQQGQPFLINTSAGRLIYCHRKTEWSLAPSKRNTSAHFAGKHSESEKRKWAQTWLFLHRFFFFLLFPPSSQSVSPPVSVSDDPPWSESEGGTATNSNSAPAAALHSDRSFIPQLPYLLDHLSDE